MIIKEVKEIATFGDVMVRTTPIDTICNVLRLNDYLLDMIEDDEKVAVFNNTELLLK